ncbi:hypothetical protein DPMN_065359 [Dreissena polymorpha]|uniref:Uncharacterized protein n=1 Tax=Dreissena polymorpha TaxID=45954 RepID=A0A9D4CF40_DREPO|nr:hypothetical protein DPMN_065359 [Dreissena polymorpha]
MGIKKKWHPKELVAHRLLELCHYSTAKAEQTYFAIRGGKAKRVDALQSLKPRQNFGALLPRFWINIC